MWEVTSWKTQSEMEGTKAGRGPRNHSLVWLHMLPNATCRKDTGMESDAARAWNLLRNYVFFFIIFFSHSGHAWCYRPSGQLMVLTSESAAAFMATGGFWLFPWFNFGLKVISEKLLFSFCVENVRVRPFSRMNCGSQANLAYNGFVYREGFSGG